jgi:hypothetical protein
LNTIQPKTWLFILISLISISTITCTSPKTKIEDIEGKWLAIDREPGIPGRSGQVGFTIEFFNDNTVVLPSGKRSWSILADGRVNIDVPEMPMYGYLNEDILTITIPDKTKILFKKQR